ncbi:unnamed protein product [Callosobruchus maculatus]|uniref:Uncharacterized protein n=1 Tax=Callosobruchus maculatus TaxID=64391 RepID=A0A653BND8_CALMS|nr:unnamed protein product [Callosobruchus maculatus]
MGCNTSKDSIEPRGENKGPDEDSNKEEKGKQENESNTNSTSVLTIWIRSVVHFETPLTRPCSCNKPPGNKRRAAAGVPSRNPPISTPVTVRRSQRAAGSRSATPLVFYVGTGAIFELSYLRKRKILQDRPV